MPIPLEPRDGRRAVRAIVEMSHATALGQMGFERLKIFDPVFDRVIGETSHREINLSVRKQRIVATPKQDLNVTEFLVGDDLLKFDNQILFDFERPEQPTLDTAIDRHKKKGIHWIMTASSLNESCI